MDEPRRRLCATNQGKHRFCVSSSRCHRTRREAIAVLTSASSDQDPRYLAALDRLGRAEDRAERARKHRDQARLQAEADDDPAVARRHREEAELHDRALRLQQRAIELQIHHAEEFKTESPRP